MAEEGILFEYGLRGQSDGVETDDEIREAVAAKHILARQFMLDHSMSINDDTYNPNGYISGKTWRDPATGETIPYGELCEELA